MAGWHHPTDGLEFEELLELARRSGVLQSGGGRKESTQTE